jgi:hypothetical protein
VATINKWSQQWNQHRRYNGFEIIPGRQALWQTVDDTHAGASRGRSAARIALPISLLKDAPLADS